MTSAVDITVPDATAPTTASVRANFSAIKDEIEALQGNEREKLTADRTYYIAASGGSDSNDGLTVGAPFATFAKFETVRRDELDLNGYNVTLQFAAGTYTERMFLRGPSVGQKTIDGVKLLGDATTPSNVVVATTGAGTDSFLVTDGAWCEINGFRITSDAGDAINTARQSQVWYQNVEIGGCGGDAQVYAAYSRVQAIGDYSIIGNCARHFLAEVMGEISHTSITITLTGTPDFSFAFASIGENSMYTYHMSTFTGAATGRKYVIADGGVIVPRSTLDDLPGDAAGTETILPYPRNFAYNPSFAVAQRGASFTSATTPANNDDTYLLDRWLLLSDGNDIVDVTQGTDGAVGAGTYCQLDVETTAKKFGICQILPNKDVQELLGLTDTMSVSFRARVSDASKLSRIGVLIASWSSTADSVTSDIVSAWGAEGASPTLATNWTIEGSNLDLGVTTTDAIYRLENIAIDTASTKNVALFIFSNDVATNDTAGSLLQITDVQWSAHPFATKFESRPLTSEVELCQAFFEKSYNLNVAPGTASTTVGIRFATAKAAIADADYYGPTDFRKTKILGTPTVTIYDFSGNAGRVSTAGGVSQGASSGIASFVGESGFTGLNSTGGNITPSDGGFIFHWTAEKEL